MGALFFRNHEDIKKPPEGGFLKLLIQFYFAPGTLPSTPLT